MEVLGTCAVAWNRMVDTELCVRSQPEAMQWLQRRSTLIKAEWDFSDMS
jgi:hypothetical protein